MRKIAGIMGVHRTGKTTLARRVAEELGIGFVETKTSEIIKNRGIDLSKALTFEDRLNLQESILEGALELWNSEKGLFITDRTPLDMLGYFMVEMLPGLNEDQETAFWGYYNRCWSIFNQTFDAVALIQPGILLIREENKGALSPAYMEHLNCLYMGMLLSEQCQVPRQIMSSDITDLQSRTKIVADFIARQLVDKYLRHTTMEMVN